MLRNTGRTPARNLRVNGGVGFGEPGIKIDVTRVTELMRQAVDSIGLLMPNVINVLDYPLSDTVTQEMLEDIKVGKKGIMVFGRVTYDDIFGHPHWTTFCYRVNSRLILEIDSFGNDSDEVILL